ncbi:ribosomal RNA small subunit methyltransferase G [Planctomycetales bacterium]|nr:ribosomal RNA small subunit methyltransferase G [Planctomycetales bacterium]
MVEETTTLPSPSLAETLKHYGISLPKVQVRKLNEYCNLLWSWNERLNLTRHTDYDKFVSRDVVDSMSLAEFLRDGEHILDVGTGGGVPGIVLAILRPDLQVELCDSTGKKAFAVSEMLRELRLDIPIHHAKAEKILSQPGVKFTTLTIRAVSRLVELLRMVAPHWSSFGRLLLVKGPKWVDERGESRHYNLTTKLALRCLKTYPTKIAENETIDSVILQLCLKENFARLDDVIDELSHGNKHTKKEPRG